MKPKIRKWKRNVLLCAGSALLLLPLFPRFVYVLRVLEGYSLSYVASILNVDEEACQAALAYFFGAFAEALMPVQLAKQQ